jgi:hypothetical protein
MGGGAREEEKKWRKTWRHGIINVTLERQRQRTQKREGL